MKKLFITLMTATFAMTTNAQPQLRADNIDEVLQAMTLEEKAKLLVGGANNFFGTGAVVGGEADLVAGAAGTSPAIPRLGIPATVLTDGPAGVRIDPTRKGTEKTYYATAFPIGSCLASTCSVDVTSNIIQKILFSLVRSLPPISMVCRVKVPVYQPSISPSIPRRPIVLLSMSVCLSAQPANSISEASRLQSVKVIPGPSWPHIIR